MGFLNDCGTIIRRSSKDIFYIYTAEDGLYYNYYDSDNNLVNKNKIVNSTSLDFSKYSFSLDNNDNIYGIYCDNQLQTLYFDKNTSTFIKRESITYNYKKFGLVFPYIKHTDNYEHIFYYVFTNSSPSNYALFHHLKHKNHWIENKIDFINNIILDNFTIAWNNSVPTIFYLKIIDGYEEVFASRFNLGTFCWSEPIQITNSKKNKLYLSVIRDNMNFYHLVFCENIKNGYAVRYINGYLNDNKFSLSDSNYLNSQSACMYPSIIKKDNILCCNWVDTNKLYTSKYIDSKWNVPFMEEDSLNDNFMKVFFYSNYNKDCNYNLSHSFSTTDDIGLIGI